MLFCRVQGGPRNGPLLFLYNSVELESTLNNSWYAMESRETSTPKVTNSSTSPVNPSHCALKKLRKSFSAISRLRHLQLQLEQFPHQQLTFIFFTDEKLFTVSHLRTHKMTWYTRPCQPDISASRLLLMDPTFLQVRKVSVAVSKRGYTNLIFIVPGAKIKR